jgi:Na+/H+ antiporter NhaA
VPACDPQTPNRHGNCCDRADGSGDTNSRATDPSIPASSVHPGSNDPFTQHLEGERGAIGTLGLVAVTSTTRRTVAELSDVRRFVHTENASTLVLLGATIAALVWANSPWSSSYDEVWHTELAIRLGGHEFALDLRDWINDGLMAFFFFVAGLEIRREIDMGELRERSRVALPVIAACGGMVVPAAIYLSVNSGSSSASGWGIVMGTDTAFALGVLTLAGGATPRVRAFLLSMVVVDDAIALTVIAVAYTDELSVGPLVIALLLLGVVVALHRVGVRNGLVYFVVAVGVWSATLASGVHPTIAGVAIGLLATAYPPSRADLTRASRTWRLFREEPTPALARTASRSVARTVSPNERLQFLYHPWTSFVVVPLFALANAGVTIETDALRDAATSPITLGIIGGLVAGKFLGVTVATWLGWKLAHLPLTINSPSLVGVGTVAGVGFTVSLLIADVAFEGPDLADAKLGILGASILAACISVITFRAMRGLRRSARGGSLAAPIIDLSDPVDPTVDHVRGDLAAPLVLVEYGDFECPHCLGAEATLLHLRERFGDDLAFVFRHLPLEDVHEHARLAAEASEVAAEQGAFWSMHDLLFEHQDALTEHDLLAYAEQLGLDTEQFLHDLRHRRRALRVERDIASADDSGAAGTPTFFINGLRHQASSDLAALTAALEQRLLQVRTANAR